MKRYRISFHASAGILDAGEDAISFQRRFMPLENFLALLAAKSRMGCSLYASAVPELPPKSSSEMFATMDCVKI